MIDIALSDLLDEADDEAAAVPITLDDLKKHEAKRSDATCATPQGRKDASTRPSQRGN